MRPPLVRLPASASLPSIPTKWLAPDRNVPAASTLGLGLTFDYACRRSISNYSCSLHSHKFSSDVPLSPADCASAIKDWFAGLENLSTGTVNSVQTQPETDTSALFSSIATQV
jgi:hypothetical protein